MRRFLENARASQDNALNALNMFEREIKGSIDKLLSKVAVESEPSIALEATLCLDVSRKQGDTTPDSAVVARWAEDFVQKQWPGRRFPKLYYDPRALQLHTPGTERAVLHAKVIVADDARALVTSANLTAAAQHRNIELGLLVREPTIALAVRQHFEHLIADQFLKRLPTNA